MIQALLRIAGLVQFSQNVEVRQPHIIVFVHLQFTGRLPGLPWPTGTPTTAGPKPAPSPGARSLAANIPNRVVFGCWPEVEAGAALGAAASLLLD